MEPLPFFYLYKGQGQPQRMQINIGQGPSGMMGLSTPGMPMGISLGPRVVRPPGMQRNESGTQTAGANGIPANSGTQTPGKHDTLRYKDPNEIGNHRQISLYMSPITVTNFVRLCMKSEC